MMHNLKRPLLLLSLSLPLGIGSGGDLAAQTPSGVDRISQPALVVQRLGTTEARIVYNRPTARGCELFGALVPWDSVWNPGADEATRIEVNEDMMLAAQRLSAALQPLGDAELRGVDDRVQQLVGSAASAVSAWDGGVDARG